LQLEPEVIDPRREHLKTRIRPEPLEVVEGNGFAKGDGAAVAEEVRNRTSPGPGVEGALDRRGQNGAPRTAEQQPCAAFELVNVSVG